MTRCKNHDCAENSLCSQCRADLRLGRMVRKVPQRWFIEHTSENLWHCIGYDSGCGEGDTPEAAIDAAKGDGE